MQIRVVLAVAAVTALSGCAGLSRSRTGAPATSAADPGDERRAGDGARPARREAAAEAPERVAGGDDVRAHVAARMPSLRPEHHDRLAQTIHEEATRARFDAFLVLAMIQVESGFDPRAVSRAGAVGLMQLRAPTMREVAAQTRLASTNRRDPVANVRAGVRYLRRMVDRFGELDLALIAYNAGPARLRAHLDRGDLPRRLRSYPRKVKAELARLRAVPTPAAVPAPAAAAAAAPAHREARLSNPPRIEPERRPQRLRSPVGGDRSSAGGA